MLDRRHRLTGSAGFALATRRGRRAGTSTLVLHLASLGAGDGPPRVGFVVSKRVGNAVVRNRVQRRLRHLVRARVAVLPAAATLVVRALPASAGATYDALERDLDGALRRLVPTTDAVGTGGGR